MEDRVALRVLASNQSFPKAHTAMRKLDLGTMRLSECPLSGWTTKPSAPKSKADEARTNREPITALPDAPGLANSLLLASTARPVSLPPSSVSGAQGTGRKPRSSPRHVSDRIGGSASPRLPATGSDQGVGRPRGPTWAGTKRDTAPTVDNDGFDKAIMYAAVLHVPVALG